MNINTSTLRIEELEKQNSELLNLVKFIANDYVELSHDKVLWQRNDFMKRCKKFLNEHYAQEDPRNQLELKFENSLGEGLLSGDF